RPAEPVVLPFHAYRGRGPVPAVPVAEDLGDADPSPGRGEAVPRCDPGVHEVPGHRAARSRAEEGARGPRGARELRPGARTPDPGRPHSPDRPPQAKPDARGGE